MTEPTKAPVLDDGVVHDALDGPLHNPDVAHEHSDINVRAIIVFMLILSAVTAVAAGAMLGVFKVLDGMSRSNDPQLSPHAEPATEMPRSTAKSPEFGAAPRPRLLTDEPLALEDTRSETTKLLETGDWIDQGTGIGRMPIDEAKKVLLHKGLPVRPGTPADSRLGTRAAAMADPSSGRLAVAKPPHKPGGGH